MTKLHKRALIIGGSRGVGRALALSLVGQGTHTTVVARTAQPLEALASEDARIDTIVLDASIDGTASDLVKRVKPDLLILTAGFAPEMRSFFKQSWAEFSGAWNTDTKIAHSFFSAALNTPMAPGGTIVSLSSGAGLSGSRLSGSYAGAKRMQHFLTEYAQWEGELLGRDLTFYSIIPKQLIAGSDIGLAAAQAYATANGNTVEKFMGQWEKPLEPSDVAGHVMRLIARHEPPKTNGYIVTGTGMVAA